MNIKWDAENYRDNFSFVHEYGEDVLSLLKAEKGSRVLDLGCGNGALSAKLKEAGFIVTGVDASAEMIAIAEKAHPGIEFIRADALSFSPDKKFDAVFSNAVIHWIDAKEQGHLAKNIASLLAPGGEFVCEFGGKDCAEAVHSALEAAFACRGVKYPRTFFFPTIGEYAPILEAAGLKVTYAALFPRPTLQKTGVSGWIKMFIKEPFYNIPPATAEEITAEAEEACRKKLFKNGEWYVDYVRIRIRAEKE